MPITIEWDDAERTCIRTTTSESFTWEEYSTTMESVFRMLDENPQATAVISVRREGSRLATDGNPFAHFQKTVERFMQYTNLVVINVNARSTSELMGNVFARQYPGLEGRVFHVATLEEARGILNTLRLVERVKSNPNASNLDSARGVTGHSPSPPQTGSTPKDGEGS